MPVDSPHSGPIGNLIFLSYRRADTAPQTLALKLELERHLSAVQVFMDNGAIAGGDKFPDEINNALSAAALVIAMIGKKWFGVSKDGNGRTRRRIDDPKDWVFEEVSFALRHRPNAFLPVLVDDATNILAESVPKELKDLSNFQTGRIAVAQWESSINQLLTLLEKKFRFIRKPQTYEYPKPDTLKAKTPPYSWEILETYVKPSLPFWVVEFQDDPDRLFYKWVNLRRDFKFSSFDKAIAFANMIAQHSKDEERHPQFLVTWKTVSVWTSTWDAGHRITPYDIAFAKYLEKKYKTEFG